MPRLSVWMVRASLVYLGLGVTFGALLLANKGVPLAPALWALLPLHVECVLIGWTVQLAMGVAYWILPRFGGERRREGLGWLAFALLNAGILTAGTGSWVAGLASVTFLGRLAELLAAAAFALHAWPRVKPPGA